MVSYIHQSNDQKTVNYYYHKLTLESSDIYFLMIPILNLIFYNLSLYFHIQMRAWDAFGGLDSTVKNMLTSLRAVGELQNPAIRDRHWQQLMQATKVAIPIMPAPVYL